MTILLIASVLLCFTILFGTIAALLLVPSDLVAEACRPGDPPPRRSLPRATDRVHNRGPKERRAA